MAPGRSDPDEPVSRAERQAARRAERTLRKAARRARRSAEHAGRGDGRDAVYESIDPAARADRRLLRRARRRAHRRLGFVTHFGTYAATLALLLVATRSVRLVVFVGLAWGIGVFCHYLWALVAPGLRDHWIEREVGARSARDVASERRQVGRGAGDRWRICRPRSPTRSAIRSRRPRASCSRWARIRRRRRISSTRASLSQARPRRAFDLAPAALCERGGAALRARGAARAGSIGGRGAAGSCGVGGRSDRARLRRAARMRGDPEAAPRARRPDRECDRRDGGGGGRLRHASGSPGGTSLSGDELWLRVADEGPGIAAQERERIWSPFHTTRADGTGLGLALSRKTVEAHGGRIELAADAPVGAVFEITLPRHAEPRDAGRGDGAGAGASAEDRR
ncbi:MAG: ATP-binding protein [Myxococcota bacterium]